MFVALDVCTAGIADPEERGLPCIQRDGLKGSAVRVIPGHDLRTHTDWVLGQAHAFGNVVFEHETEAASVFQAVDLGPKVRPERRVLDLVEEDVQLAANHAVRLLQGETGFGSLGPHGRQLGPAVSMGSADSHGDSHGDVIRCSGVAVVDRSPAIGARGVAPERSMYAQRTDF